MATINKTFKTKYTSIEMKNYISTQVLPNPALKSLLETVRWEANTLYINSKLGHGTIKLEDNSAHVYIELNLFGSMAKKAIESTLDSEFKQLESKK